MSTPPPLGDDGGVDLLPRSGDYSLIPFPDFPPRDAHGGVELGVLGGEVVVSTTILCEFTSFSWCSSLGAIFLAANSPHTNASTFFMISAKV